MISFSSRAGRTGMRIIANPGNGVFWVFGGWMLFYAITILGGGAIVGYLGLLEIALGCGFMLLGTLSWIYPVWITRKIREAEVACKDETIEWPPRE
jgi:uncharacterized membrane protein